MCSGEIAKWRRYSPEVGIVVKQSIGNCTEQLINRKSNKMSSGVMNVTTSGYRGVHRYVPSPVKRLQKKIFYG